MGDTRKRTSKDKMYLASKALLSRLEEMERTKSSGRLILEINLNCGGIVNASISTQEPVFQNYRKQEEAK
jgi:hypothetical protein